MSAAQAAKALKVSEPSVERAKKRMREDPVAHERAKAGTLPRKKPEPRPRPFDLVDIPIVEVSAESVHTMSERLNLPCLKAFNGTCKLVTKTGSLTPRSWVVRRASHNRKSGEPVELFITSGGGYRGDIYELTPDEARELAKALMSYAEWLDPERVAAVTPEPIEPPALPAPTESDAPVEPEPMPINAEPVDPDDLRSWAQTIPIDLLAKHLRAAGYDNVGTSLSNYLAGKQGSYHLRDALNIVRGEYAGWQP
jgi:hypothetical protein